MPNPDPARDEAFRRLQERIGHFESSRVRKRRFEVEGGAGDGYRLLAELIGGVLAGLGFGWIVDQVAHTSPWGLIGGVLIGTGASVFMVVRSAGRMSAEAKAAADPGEPAAADDADDDSGLGLFGPKEGD
jgi:ATP synthase protein I